MIGIFIRLSHRGDYLDLLRELLSDQPKDVYCKIRAHNTDYILDTFHLIANDNRPNAVRNVSAP